MSQQAPQCDRSCAVGGMDCILPQPSSVVYVYSSWRADGTQTARRCFANQAPAKASGLTTGAHLEGEQLEPPLPFSSGAATGWQRPDLRCQEGGQRTHCRPTPQGMAPPKLETSAFCWLSISLPASFGELVLSEQVDLQTRRMSDRIAVDGARLPLCCRCRRRRRRRRWLLLSFLNTVSNHVPSQLFTKTRPQSSRAAALSNRRPFLDKASPPTRPHSQLLHRQ